MKKLFSFIIAALFIFPCVIHAQTELSGHLKPLEPFVGKTWKGVFANPDKDKMTQDVSRWERALNGQAIRILHSVNDGEYGGESIVMWDPDKESLIFYYFTTAGFFTNGTIKFENGQFISHEYVTGEKSGITEVMGAGKMLPDGRYLSKSKYLQNGKWVEGHEIYYVEDPEAKVIMK
ncbi:MAG: hypothetical protein AB7T22_08420 [Calditrichaceae bacterium]